jgi:hypothetical protein
LHKHFFERRCIPWNIDAKEGVTVSTVAASTTMARDN